jgi:hypothetical protein
MMSIPMNTMTMKTRGRGRGGSARLRGVFGV